MDSHHGNPLEAAERLLEREACPDVRRTQTASSRKVLTRLYVSHFLSTWNSRMFEFGAVLFLASIFQGTLLYASIYALVRSASAVVLSSWLGSKMDRSNRLVAIRHSIVWQRVPVAVSCACFVALLMPSWRESEPIISGLFLAVVLLACMEKLAATANTVAVERDWVIIVSDTLAIERQDLNASMRRIDLFCKLVAPVVISLFDGLSTKVAVWTVLGVNVLCVFIEYIAIAQVYKAIPELVRTASVPPDYESGAVEDAPEHHTASQQSLIKSAIHLVKRAASPWREYVASPVFLASFSLSLLYLTVLSFGTTMVTYLLHTGFDPLQVSCMRIGAVLAELSGTWAAPFMMGRIGPIRSGLWFLNWQLGCLATAAVAFALYDSNSRLVAVSLILGVALSRIGLWGFDLSVQFLVQEGVEEDARGRFSSTEMGVQNVFEMLSFATTIVFPLPEQFKYPVFISYGAIALAAICFAAYAPPRARGQGRSGPRRRSGCLTCRARKVRCDEAKPICANCTRLRLGCVYKTIVPAAVPRQANGRTTAVTGNPTANTFQRPDASYFRTVLRPDGQQAYRPPQTADASQLRSVDNAATSPGPFDMLGFMSEITSELERKHLDLTNGLSEFTNATSAKASDDTANVPHTDRSMSWDSSVYSKGTQSQSPATEGMWLETGAAYEEHLLAYFLNSEPPATIFGPVNLEWKYVREVIVAQSGDFQPLRNSIYCFAEVHKAIREGSQPNSASTYHQQASLEGQSYIFEHVDEPTLVKVFTTVFLLMLSESLSSPDLGRHGTSFLHSAYLLLQRFPDQIQSWTGFGRLVVSWVSLLDVKSLIAGRDGDPLIELGSLAELSTEQNESSGAASGQSSTSSGIMDDRPIDKKVSEDYLLSKPGYLVYDAIVGPAFRFFVRAQQIIRRIVCIDLHHRSRGTLGDEFEVLQIAHRVGADLETLWNCRPPVLDVYDRPEELLDSLSQSVADEVCRTFRQYVANFLAIFIYLHRVAFAIYPRTDRVNRAVDQIIQLATAESASTQRHLPVSFFWPLFIAGLEGTLIQRRWIVQEMQRMVACDSDMTQRHPNASKVLFLLEEMTRRQDASRTWADSRCVRRELFTDFYVLI
ncbi:hypothetical protein Aspvir_003807 [Aspergillus viridinutans]|uniref:Zn(2)-C6 fungal-type domain-containing protein n=1 Tax=Aspergillus viridinutans TaxID=75553 RepID=A0A9P3BP89_ASPVI|nr:uncharacterized protein Aspvir_003807 [Aspergillus viridinutans]GIJ99804.1 hypothetical protein Aspvir_003807 [Aspergillus viridinutans]